MAVAGALALGVGGLGYWALAGDGDGGDGDTAGSERAAVTRTGSKEVEGAAPVEIERTPAAYRIVYRLEEHGGREVALSTDKVWVRRPFDSRLETWRGAPPGRTRLSTETGSFARRRFESTSADPSVFGVPPSVAPADVRVLPALVDAEAHGFVERREVREVLGRRCQVLRTGDVLGASVLRKPTAEDHSESCVDAAGLVLEDLLVVGGEVLSRRLAVEVEEDPTLADDLFRTGARTLEVRDGGGLVRRMGEGLPQGEFFLLDPSAVPAGFERTGRFNVIPSQPENFNDPLRESARETSFADVYVRGADFFVVDQGGTLGGVDPFVEDPAALRTDLGAVGSGEVRLGALGVEVRAKRRGGRFVRLRGTLPVQELSRIGAALRAVEGTGPLEFFEEPGA